MAENFNGIPGIPDLDLSFTDIPGQYIDDVLNSELPGSHLDQLLYGELPGSHLDVVVNAPLPGGSTDELLNLHAPEKARPKQRTAGKPAKRRTDSREIQEKKEYLEWLEQSGYQAAQKSRDMISQNAGNGANDLQGLWGTIRNNIQQNMKSRTVSTPQSRARNTSRYAQKEIKKEKKKRKKGSIGILFVMIFLITMLNRVIVPLVNQISSGIHSIHSKPAVEADVDDAELTLTDAEFESVVNLWETFVNSNYSEDMNLSEEDFVTKYEAFGFEMQSNQNRGMTSGSYVDMATWVSIFRNDDYIDYSCQTTSDEMDLDVVHRALDGVAPEAVCENLGQSVTEIGLSEELFEKFRKYTDESGYVSYSKGDFAIYYYDYDDSTGLFLCGKEDQIYASVNKKGDYLERVSIWK